MFDGLENLEKENDNSIFGEFKYENNNIAFDTASNSFKDLIKNHLENKRDEKRH